VTTYEEGGVTRKTGGRVCVFGGGGRNGARSPHRVAKRAGTSCKRKFVQEDSLLIAPAFGEGQDESLSAQKESRDEPTSPMSSVKEKETEMGMGQTSGGNGSKESGKHFPRRSSAG